MHIRPTFCPLKIIVLSEIAFSQKLSIFINLLISIILFHRSQDPNDGFLSIVYRSIVGKMQNVGKVLVTLALVSRSQ